MKNTFSRVCIAAALSLIIPSIVVAQSSCDSKYGRMMTELDKKKVAVETRFERALAALQGKKTRALGKLAKKEEQTKKRYPNCSQ